MKCMARLSLDNMETCQKDAVAYTISPGQQSYFCAEHLAPIVDGIKHYHLEDEVKVISLNSSKPTTGAKSH